MLSAFGVDHGEISKGRGIFYPRLPKVASRAQKATQGTGVATGPQRVKAALNRAGDAPVTIKGVGRASARTMRGVGGVFEGHPGLTGTALVGGGGVAGYQHLKNKEPRKKKS